METIEFKYDPDREIMREMKEELRKLVLAIEVHDSVCKSFINRNQPIEFKKYLQSVVDACDEILYEAVDRFCEWRETSQS